MIHSFRHLVWGVVVVALTAACAGGPQSGEIREADLDERQARIETRLTYRDLVNFADVLADKMRQERYFVDAVAKLDDSLGRPPNLAVVQVVNATDDDTIPVQGGLVAGFQEAFYASEKVNFVKNADNVHLKLRLKLYSRRNFGEDGAKIVDYWARVQVHRLVLPDDPDQSPYDKLVGVVNEPLRLIKDGRSLM